MVDGEATERLLDIVWKCVTDGTMRYVHGDDDKIYVQLVGSGALFEIVPGGLIRKHTNPDDASSAGPHRGLFDIA